MISTELEKRGYIESRTRNCMCCGAEYDLQQRSEEIRDTNSKNAISCCSNNCLALEDLLQETN